MTRLERFATVATVAISAGGLGLAGLQYMQPDKPANPPVTASPIPIQISVAPVPSPSPASKLQQVMIARTVGRQLDYLEEIIGKPAEIIGAFRYYEVDGCRVALKANADRTVTLVSLNVTPACTFEWRDMMPNLPRLPRPEQTTLANFFPFGAGEISQVSGCVSLCGNAAAPEVTVARPGSHADNWINARLIVVVDGGRAGAISGRFSEAVRQTVGETAASDLSAVCDSRIAALTLTHLGALRPDRVEFSSEPFPVADPGTYTISDCDLTLS